MLFIVIERFNNRDAKAVYSRFKEKGRMMPDGLKYVSSWVEDNFDRCFQLMECDDPRLFQEWIVNWKTWGTLRLSMWFRQPRPLMLLFLGGIFQEVLYLLSRAKPIW